MIGKHIDFRENKDPCVFLCLFLIYWSFLLITHNCVVLFHGVLTVNLVLKENVDCIHGIFCFYLNSIFERAKSVEGTCYYNSKNI